LEEKKKEEGLMRDVASSKEKEAAIRADLALERQKEREMLKYLEEIEASTSSSSINVEL